MKNIHEILKEYGMEVPADKKADFDKAWKENYRTKSEYDNAVTQRDNYKASLDDVNTRLKEFEGVDVKDLQGQITKLQGDLKAKDDEYAAKEADRVFMDSVKEAVKAAGGRNEKAVIAMLNIDALKESKNQSEDIKKALEDVKKSDGVHVHVDHKTAVTDNGLKSAEVYKIRIPADIPEAGQYLPPDQFACCGGYGYWTIQNDDQIVLGECQIEIEKPADLKAVFQKHCKVTSWSDNRFGTVPHWRIGGE